jgi:hypothetical protein
VVVFGQTAHRQDLLRGEVSLLASKIGCAGLFVAARKGLYDEQRIWMDGGGMWIWTVIGVLVVVLLVIAINKLSKK